MMKFIEENQYIVQYKRSIDDSYLMHKRYIADSIEDAIDMLRTECSNCFITRVEFIDTVKRKATKTITVEV